MNSKTALPPWLLQVVEDAGDATVILKPGDRPYVVRSKTRYHLGTQPLTNLMIEGLAQQILSEESQHALYSGTTVEETLAAGQTPVTVEAARMDYDVVIRLRPTRESTPDEVARAIEEDTRRIKAITAEQRAAAAAPGAEAAIADDAQATVPSETVESQSSAPAATHQQEQEIDIPVEGESVDALIGILSTAPLQPSESRSGPATNAPETFAASSPLPVALDNRPALEVAALREQEAAARRELEEAVRTARAEAEAARQALEAATHHAEEEAARRTLEEAARKKEESARIELEGAVRAARQEAEATREALDAATRQALEDNAHREQADAARRDQEQSARRELEEALRQAREEAQTARQAVEAASLRAEDATIRRRRQEVELLDHADVKRRELEDKVEAARQEAETARQALEQATLRAEAETARARDEGARRDAEEAARRNEEFTLRDQLEEGIRAAREDAESARQALTAAAQRAEAEVTRRDAEDAVRRDQETALRKELEEAVQRAREDAEAARQALHAATQQAEEATIRRRRQEVELVDHAEMTRRQLEDNLQAVRQEAETARQALEQATRRAEEERIRVRDEAARREAEEATRRDEELALRSQLEEATRLARQETDTARRALEAATQRVEADAARRDEQEAARRNQELAIRHELEESVRRAREEAATARQALEAATQAAEDAANHQHQRELELTDRADPIRHELEEQLQAARQEAEAARQALEQATRRAEEESAQAHDAATRRDAEDAARREEELARQEAAMRALERAVERAREEAQAARTALAAATRRPLDENEREHDARPPAVVETPRRARVRETSPGVVVLNRPIPASGGAPDLTSWIVEAISQGATALYLRPGSPPYVRINGKVTSLAVEPLPVSMFERAGAVLSAGGDGWSAAGRWAWSKAIAGSGTIQCQAFPDEQGGGFVVQLPLQTETLQQYLPKHIRTACASREGLIVVSAPFDEDVTAMLGAVACWSTSLGAGHIITFGTAFGSGTTLAANAFISDRPLPEDDNEMAAALQRALRESPDILVVHANNHVEAAASSLVSAAVGRLVVVGLVGRTSPRALDRLLEQMDSATRRRFAEVFKAACSSRWLRRDDGTRAVVSDILMATPEVSALVETADIAGLHTLQRDRHDGMRTVDSALARAVKRRKLELREAAASAVDRRAMVAMVRQQTHRSRAAHTRPRTNLTA